MLLHEFSSSSNCLLYPNIVVSQDGRLLSGDHLLQIGDVNVRGMGSEQVASVLRQSGAHVRLIVARPVNEPTPNVHSNAQVVPTYQLDEHLHNINQTLSMMDDMNEYNMGVSSDYFAQIHSVRCHVLSVSHRTLCHISLSHVLYPKIHRCILW